MHNGHLVESEPPKPKRRTRASSRPPARHDSDPPRTPRETTLLTPESLRYALSEVTITIEGETGTGKDRLARALHAHSPRAMGPFVVVDCGSVVATLAESELFGHERGSFTGAVATHAGAFERAHGGTLFLDEIGELPLDLQPRLLRALENREVRRVGGTETLTVDVRVIAATNRHLQREVEAGRFRADLYHRLSGAFIHVPPLRLRQEQIPALVQGLLKDLGRPEVIVAPEALKKLEERPWLGNVRELKNTINCALAFVDHGVIDAGHIEEGAGASDSALLERYELGGVPLEDLEWEAIRQTLEQTRGNRVRTAERLGIAVSTLYEKLRKYGLS